MQLNDSPLDWKRRSALDKAGLVIATVRPPTTVLLCTVGHVGGRHQALAARATEAAGKFEKS